MINQMKWTIVNSNALVYIIIRIFLVIVEHLQIIVIWIMKIVNMVPVCKHLLINQKFNYSIKSSFLLYVTQNYVLQVQYI